MLAVRSKHPEESGGFSNGTERPGWVISPSFEDRLLWEVLRDLINIKTLTTLCGGLRLDFTGQGQL
jgi:hypothetical protein